jgi:hypothetical protein
MLAYLESQYPKWFRLKISALMLINLRYVIACQAICHRFMTFSRIFALEAPDVNGFIEPWESDRDAAA